MWDALQTTKGEASSDGADLGHVAEVIDVVTKGDPRGIHAPHSLLSGARLLDDKQVVVSEGHCGYAVQRHPQALGVEEEDKSNESNVGSVLS